MSSNCRRWLEVIASPYSSFALLDSPADYWGLHPDFDGMTTRIIGSPSKLS